jgi:hypothetical protein
MTIGLADWHIYEIGKGHKTALRQTPTNLFLILMRPGTVEWRRYADVHGTILIATGTSSTLENAMTEVQSVADQSLSRSTSAPLLKVPTM